MQLEGVGVIRPNNPGPYQLRLKFGQRAYCVVELSKGEDAASAAAKLRELAAQVEARSR